jgi:hypothetical protein
LASADATALNTLIAKEKPEQAFGLFHYALAGLSVHSETAVFTAP